MKRVHCDPSMKNTPNCPISEKGRSCFVDIHHLEYPAKDYQRPIDKLHREQDFNKARVCRALHDAIHASGYVPEKPERADMFTEIHDTTPEAPPERAVTELAHQLQLGQQILGLTSQEGVI